MILTLTWLAGVVIFISEMAKSGAFRERGGDGTLATVLYMLISLATAFAFALVLASRHTSLFGIQAQTLDDVIEIADRIASLLTTYYVFIVFALIAGGVALLLGARRLPRRAAHPWGVLALVVLVVLVGATAAATNLTPIQADIVYKQADPYDRGRQWMAAIEHYKHAIELAPREDFYYLYLGRAYLEYASTLEDPAVRDTVMRETEQVLMQAREINPLNTDHSANLARMYRRWADTTPDAELRPSLLQRSSENYAIATSLSPQNAILWNEWAMLYYYGVGDVASYERTLQHSLELDSGFDQTWLMCGDVNRQEGEPEEAAHCYEEALELNPRAPQVWRVLGDTYITLQRWEGAINALTRALELRPDADDAWNIHNVLARLYSQLGQQEQALVHANTALQLAPEDQQAMLQELIAQLHSMETPQP
jgi:tetratricopeptide (TPR) repeat protein